MLNKDWWLFTSVEPPTPLHGFGGEAARLRSWSPAPAAPSVGQPSSLVVWLHTEAAQVHPRSPAASPLTGPPPRNLDDSPIARSSGPN